MLPDRDYGPRLGSLQVLASPGRFPEAVEAGPASGQTGDTATGVALTTTPTTTPAPLDSQATVLRSGRAKERDDPLAARREQRRQNDPNLRTDRVADVMRGGASAASQSPFAAAHRALDSVRLRSRPRRL